MGEKVETEKRGTERIDFVFALGAFMQLEREHFGSTGGKQLEDVRKAGMELIEQNRALHVELQDLRAWVREAIANECGTGACGLSQKGQCNRGCFFYAGKKLVGIDHPDSCFIEETLQERWASKCWFGSKGECNAEN